MSGNRFRYVLVLIALLPQCVWAQYKHTLYDQVTAAEDQLFGAVNEITEEYFKLDGKDTVALYTAHHSYTMDGLRLHRELVGPQVLDAYDYKYANGRLIAMENLYTQYTSPTLLSAKYTQQSRRLSTYFYTADGCPAMKVLSFISGDGDTISDTTRFVCNKECRIVEEIGAMKCHHEYDKFGSVVTSVSESYGYASHSEYDKLAHLTKATLTQGTQTATYVYSYNTNGFESDIYYSDSDGNQQSVHYDYTYDSHGNWLTRSDGTTLIRRTITYFE